MTPFAERALCASHDPATQLLERIAVDVFIKMESESETAMAHQIRLPLKAEEQPVITQLEYCLLLSLSSGKGQLTVTCRVFGTQPCNCEIVATPL